MENEILSVKNYISSLIKKDINEEIDKMIKEKLDDLEKIDVTISLLQETGIGLLINKISKMKDKLSLSSPIAVMLRNKWMDIVKNETKGVKSQKSEINTNQNNNHDNEKNNVKNDNNDSINNELKDNENNKSILSKDNEEESLSSSSNSNVSSSKKRKESDDKEVVNNNKRPKFKESSEDYQRHLRIKDKFFKYFKNDSELMKEMNIGDDLIETVSEEISYEIVTKYGSDLPQLRKTLKTYYYAFADKKNIQLRKKMLSGEISAKALLQMPESDLANPDVKIERERLEKEHSERRMPVKKTATSNYHCRQCGKNETTHFQKQTRSADEPMTTFIECIHCGNRWRH